MNRWDNVDVTKVMESGIAHSPFGQIEGLEDFREIALERHATIHAAEARNVDFGKAKFDGAYLHHCNFAACRFDRVSFRETFDRNCAYRDCSFIRCDFRSGSIGYQGSRFKNCVFDRCDFRSTTFVRPEFDECKFLNCRLDDVQFAAASFDSCVFEGILLGCVFRNGYWFESDEEESGKPRVNRMHNVSFENAELRLVGFAGGCRLDTVTLPREGEYVYARDFRRRLQRLREAVNEESIENRDGVIEFIAILEPDAKKQDEYIINIGEARTEYGDEAADLIKRTLTE